MHPHPCVDALRVMEFMEYIENASMLLTMYSMNSLNGADDALRVLWALRAGLQQAPSDCSHMRTHAHALTRTQNARTHSLEGALWMVQHAAAWACTVYCPSTTCAAPLRRAFGAHLVKLRAEPGAYGALGLAELFELREECLHEFGFSDAYRWVGPAVCVSTVVGVCMLLWV